MDCVSFDLHEYLRQTRQLPPKKRREKYETLIKEMNKEMKINHVEWNHRYGVTFLPENSLNLNYKNMKEKPRNNQKKIGHEGCSRNVPTPLGPN